MPSGGTRITFIRRALHICCKHVSDSGMHITKAFHATGPHASKPRINGTFDPAPVADPEGMWPHARLVLKCKIYKLACSFRQRKEPYHDRADPRSRPRSSK